MKNAQMTISEVIEELKKIADQPGFGYDKPVKFLDADMGFDIEFDELLSNIYDRDGVMEIQISFNVF
jgi:hypothetical protein